MDTAPIDHGQTTGGYVLTGLNAIAAQFNRHPCTIRRWIKLYGFPAERLPNGQHVTSLGRIDRWLEERATEVEK